MCGCVKKVSLYSTGTIFRRQVRYKVRARERARTCFDIVFAIVSPSETYCLRAYTNVKRRSRAKNSLLLARRDCIPLVWISLLLFLRAALDARKKKLTSAIHGVSVPVEYFVLVSVPSEN